MKLAISVCFRKVNTIKKYCPKNHTVIETDEDGKNNINSRTMAMKTREGIITRERECIKKKSNVERIRKRTRWIYKNKDRTSDNKYKTEY